VKYKTGPVLNRFCEFTYCPVGFARWWDECELVI